MVDSVVKITGHYKSRNMHNATTLIFPIALFGLSPCCSWASDRTSESLDQITLKNSSTCEVFLVHEQSDFLAVVSRISGSSFETTIPLHLYPVNSRNLKLIRGPGKTVWMLSTLGRLLDGAIRYNPATGEVINGFVGKSFAVSPDGSKIAYMDPGSPSYKIGGIIVNDHEVFPRLKSEASLSAKEYSGPFETPYDFNGQLIYFLTSDITWIDNDTIEFTMESKETGNIFQTSVSGVGKISSIEAEIRRKLSANEVKATTRPLTMEEFKAIKAQIRM